LINKEILKTKAFWIGILGAFKVITDGFGFEIANDQINSIADGLASIAIIIGIFASPKQ